MLSVSVLGPVGRELIKQSIVWVVPLLGLATQLLARVKPGRTTASVVMAEAEVKVKRTVVLGAMAPVLTTSSEYVNGPAKGTVAATGVKLAPMAKSVWFWTSVSRARSIGSAGVLFDEAAGLVSR